MNCFAFLTLALIGRKRLVIYFFSNNRFVTKFLGPAAVNFATWTIKAKQAKAGGDGLAV